MSDILEDNGSRLIVALRTIHGNQFADTCLMTMVDEMIAHRFEEADSAAFDQRMNRYIVGLDAAVHRSADPDGQHTPVTLGIINMIPRVRGAPAVEQSSAGCARLALAGSN